MKVHLSRDEMWPVFDECEERLACTTIEMTEEELQEFRQARDKFYALQRKFADIFYNEKGD